MAAVSLREVRTGDHDALFDQMRDPRWVHMAAFTAQDPDDRNAFDRWLTGLLASPDVMIWAILSNNQLAGSVAVFPSDLGLEVTYGVDPERWGQGIATGAVRLVLGQVSERPLYARTARDNTRSIHVLTACEFRPVGMQRSFAPGRGVVVEETILRRDS
jgi:RimJ/RimL family protein N-acetyltransferase